VKSKMGYSKKKVLNHRLRNLKGNSSKRKSKKNPMHKDFEYQNWLKGE